MEKIEKRHLNYLRNRLKNNKNIMEELWKAFKIFTEADFRKKRVVHNDGYDFGDASSTIDRSFAAMDALIKALPNYGNKMELNCVIHDLPLLFLNYADDIVEGDERKDAYNYLAEMLGAAPDRLLPGDFMINDDIRKTNFLSCYLMLAGLKKNATAEGAVERFKSYIERMDEARVPYIKARERMKTAKKPTKKSWLAKFLGLSDSAHTDEIEDDFDNIAIDILKKIKEGNMLSDEDLDRLKTYLLAPDNFNYALVFICFNNPAFKELTSKLTDTEVIECFEHYLARYIDPVDFSVKSEDRLLFDALFVNYIRFYLSRNKHIFDELSSKEIKNLGKKFFAMADEESYKRCANKTCELMFSFLDIQKEFVDSNGDVLNGTNRQGTVYTPRGDTSTYTEIRGEEPVSLSQREKTCVYAERLSALEDVFGSDAFAMVIAHMIKNKERIGLLDFLGIKDIPTEEDALKELVSKIHDSLISIYKRTHEIASDSGTGLSIYKDGIFLNLQSLPDIDAAVELCNEADNDADRECLIGEIIDNLRELSGELDKLTPVDDQEHNVIYYTVPVSSTGAKGEKIAAEDICVMSDIKTLSKAGQGQAIQSCLSTMHEAASQGNIDDIINGGTPVKGTNGCPIFVKNKKVIFTYAEYNVDGKHTKKIIILGAGNGESIFTRAQEIANSAEFKAFYERVCEDPSYSQPLDYAQQVLKSCSKGKARTNK